jgi:signal transduction histidine kinase
VDELFEKQVLFSRELQLKRKDGTPVWVLFNAAVYSDHDRPIVQATMIDISEWKRADEALSGMTRKLIEAQEQERARIARELHDDINQRLAMLSVELERLQQSPIELESRVQDLRRQLRQISDDVQAISYDLHSSKLEYLGAVAAMKSWCKEMAERHKVNIDFKSNVSRTLPIELGFPLFRVLQEAVINAIKHSGEMHFEVQLIEDSGQRVATHGCAALHRLLGHCHPDTVDSIGAQGEYKRREQKPSYRRDHVNKSARELSGIIQLRFVASRWVKKAAFP